ncbi:GNAT family N-acetyltransferase [Paenibacillus sp. P22]|uniref:GNAT family N-acetyltransferase n=1 Tax=Paenibacillus sp. P22 TaxID=483908 RepID=UPI002FC3C621
MPGRSSARTPGAATSPASGVEPSHEGHGLGTILFFRLCEAFRSAGAEYMSLYTGSGNPALRIYEKAGFRTVKEFAVMRKEL